MSTDPLAHLETPCLILDEARMQANIIRMQEICDQHGVELRPHIKTHKMVEVARRQLEAGAAGLVCAKLSEAEALLPSGVKSIFIAHSIADDTKICRLKRLNDALEEFVLAVTSEAHFPVLERILKVADLRLPVMMAVDTGLHREGVRSLQDGLQLAEKIRQSPQMTLHGIYCHEGHAYRRPGPEKQSIAKATMETLLDLQKAFGEKVRIWPGCSVTAAIMAEMDGVDAVRPGAYVFGDDSHARRLKTMSVDQVALTVAATVVDRPQSGLALIDAGSKVFSGDKTPDTGISGFALDGRELFVSQLSEEHGYVTGADAGSLRVGEKLRFVVAHVCPVINLAREVHLLRDGEIKGILPVEAAGCVR